MALNVVAPRAYPLGPTCLPQERDSIGAAPLRGSHLLVAVLVIVSPRISTRAS